MTQTIFLKKIPKEVNAVRINSKSDIPPFLSKTIQIVNGMLRFYTTTKVQYCPIGSVISWETTTHNYTGFCCCYISNPEEIFTETAGKFYTKPIIFKAEKVTSKIPDFFKENQKHYNQLLSIVSNSSITINDIDGAYWIFQEQNNNADILRPTDYSNYIICDKAGQELGYLT